MSMESDGQVSKGSEAQVSASMVLESRAKNRRVPFHQKVPRSAQGSHENPSNFKLVPKATKVLKIGPEATKNHKKRTLES